MNLGYASGITPTVTWRVWVVRMSLFMFTIAEVPETWPASHWFSARISPFWMAGAAEGRICPVVAFTRMGFERY